MSYKYHDYMEELEKTFKDNYIAWNQQNVTNHLLLEILHLIKKRKREKMRK